MIGRLTPNRGRFGVIVCRDFDNKELFLKRCSDSYKDQQGLIIPLTDVDLISMLEEKRNGSDFPFETIISEVVRVVTHI